MRSNLVKKNYYMTQVFLVFNKFIYYYYELSIYHAYYIFKIPSLRVLLVNSSSEAYYICLLIQQQLTYSSIKESK